MAERRWTDEQLSAINERRKTLLVSAAAGSGKTATLTERIIRSLTDEENPINIESLLVVTFTTAAAGELRAKLTAALESAVRRDPENKNLARQLNMLPSAKIRTIDSFCNDILKMGADRVGLSRGYRIADGAECELLAISIMDGLTSAIYNGELPEVATPEELEALSDCLTDSKRTEELSEVLRYVYERTSSSEHGVDMLVPMIEFYNTEKFEGVEKTPHGSYLFEITRELATHYRDVAERYERELYTENEYERMYSDMAGRDKLTMETLLSAESYGELRAAMLSFSLTTKPSKRGAEKTQTMLDYSDLRDMLREDMKKHGAYFIYTEEQWRETLNTLYGLMRTLYRVLSRFDALFLGEKKRRAALSYSDIERLSYECLIKDGERTDIAENLARQFEAIYIDEYQDVNSLQNSIFSAISRDDNRFMVGDIKQSIYGFRHARPEIFAEMKGRFPPLGESAGSAASVFMSKNFRCDRGIVDFVNGVFDRTFSLIGESIGYEDGDRLEYAKIHDGGEPPYERPVICVVEKDSEGDGEGASGEYGALAAKVLEMLSEGTLDNGKPIEPEDIAIILRSAKDKDVRYAAALEELRIPSRISGAKSFFLSAEVLLALCLLNSIDNPSRDVYLAGLMCSPLFSFTADDLYYIRHGGGGRSLYEDLVAYTEENPEYLKGKSFLSRLDYYRTIAEGMPVDVLIAKLYRETGLMSLAARSGGEDNLTLLYDYARNYEAGAYKGLYNFIAFINSIIDKNTSFDDKREGSVANAVKIITSHSSKGLEYPVVFLADTARRFTEMDVRSRLVFSMDLGVSFRPRTPSGLALVNSPIHDLTCHYILRKNHEEELRVLYVALTRARERLFVIGTSPLGSLDEYRNKMRLQRENISPYVLRRAHSYLDVILMTADAPILSESEFAPGYTRVTEEKTTSEDTAKDEFDFPVSPATCDEKLTEEFIKRFSYEYPDRYLTKLPEKLSVSRTSPNVLDESVGEIELFTDESEDEGARHLPAFVTGEGVEESAKRGIATHMFLQFCDLERLAELGAEAELDRLAGEGFLSALDKGRVRLGEIRKFARSKLFADMRGAKTLYRELRFNVRLPAQLFTENEEQREAYRDREVLVQGVIDCIVEYPDGTLGLYDYKTDRLTREELSDPALAEAKLREKHSLQLSYYALAVEKMFGKKPARVEVYSMALGSTVPVGSRGL